MLPVRHVALRHRVALRAALPYIADNTDDRHALKRVEGAIDCPAERVLFRKRSSHQRLINHRDEGPVRCIGVVEVTSNLQGNSQRREGAGRDDRKDNGRRVRVRLRRHVIDVIDPCRINVSRWRHLSRRLPVRPAAWQFEEAYLGRIAAPALYPPMAGPAPLPA